MPEVPANIQEFNTIAGLIFAQLYEAFPIVVNIDNSRIAKAIGVEGEWSKHELTSGRSFGEVLAYTTSWLAAEEYTRWAGGHPAERVTLTSKGLAALNAVPSGLKQSVGNELKNATARGSLDLSKIGDLIGGVIGGFTRSMASG
jgi:hypothetical protein